MGVQTVGVRKIGLRSSSFGDTDIDWGRRPEVLFYGLYSEISGGKMPNKVLGAIDWLTVAGLPGAETYQCPNTAAYIAADTDYIWFKQDASQRTTTTAELVTYDLPRTPVKYDNTSPNQIRAIMILKAGQNFSTFFYNRMFFDFWLSIYWDGLLNKSGRIKDNRAMGQNLWTPEPTSLRPACVLDGNTKWWIEFDDIDHITFDGSSKIQRWDSIDPSIPGYFDQSTPGVRPILGANGVVFDGVTWMQSANTFSLTQPTCSYWVLKPTTHASNARFICGYSNDQERISQNVSEGSIQFYNTNSLLGAGSLPIGSWAIMMTKMSQTENTKIQINDVLKLNTSTHPLFNVAFSGLKMASRYTNLQHVAFELKAFGFRNVEETQENWDAIYTYLYQKYIV